MRSIPKPEQLNHGELKLDEIHPASYGAMQFLEKYFTENVRETMITMESFASTIKDNRISQICHEALRKFINKLPMSDRDILGLAWTIKEMIEFKNPKKKKKKKS